MNSFARFVATIIPNIPEAVEDINQLDIVAFVIDANNEVINVRKSKIGETQEFVFD